MLQIYDTALQLWDMICRRRNRRVLQMFSGFLTIIINQADDNKMLIINVPNNILKKAVSITNGLKH